MRPTWRRLIIVVSDLQAASQQLKLSMVEKEALLPRLVEEHWLAPNPDRMGYYSIGVRSHLAANLLLYSRQH